MAISGVCLIPDCGKSSINSRGWCGLHYQRWRKHGTPLWEKAPSICSISDCGKPHYGNGFCAAHNARMRRNGHPLAGTAGDGEPMRFFKETVLTYDGDDCLAWPYGASSGYGVLDINHKKQYVHRLVCEAEHGPAPTSAHEAAHSCGNGHLACVTRRHLSWKTRAENENDKLNHGTNARGSKHGGAKLTEDAVREIRALQGKIGWAGIAQQFGVSVRTIRDIQARRRWDWLE